MVEKDRFPAPCKREQHAGPLPAPGAAAPPAAGVGAAPAGAGLRRPRCPRSLPGTRPPRGRGPPGLFRRCIFPHFPLGGAATIFFPALC